MSDRFLAIEGRLSEIYKEKVALTEEESALTIELASLHAASKGFRVGTTIEWESKEATQRGTIQSIDTASNGSKWKLCVVQESGDYAWVGPSKKPRVARPV